jgi:phosphomannomutase
MNAVSIPVCTMRRFCVMIKSAVKRLVEVLTGFKYIGEQMLKYEFLHTHTDLFCLPFSA